MVTDWIAKSLTKKYNIGNSSKKVYRLGERVYSNRYGYGYVQTFSPHGNLIVRFDGQKKNLAIYPSLLEKLS